MCCFPLGFSDLSLKVMRDGDGDGRCKEEGDKWVPCPPGVAAGTRLRNGKPLGQTIADITQTPQPSGTPDNPYTELMQSRKVSPRELAALGEGADFEAWRYNLAMNVPSVRDIPEGTPLLWRQAMKDEFKRVRKLAIDEKNKQYRRDFPDLFDEDGQIKKEKIQEYLDARMRRAQEFADRVAAAQTQVSPTSREAARSVNLAAMNNDTDIPDDEAVAKFEREFDARNPKPTREQYPDPEDYDYQLERWQIRRENYAITETTKAQRQQRRDAQNNLGKAFTHEFTSRTGRRYKVEADPMTLANGYTVINGTIWELDDNGNKINNAGYYEREIDPRTGVIQHKVFRVKPGYAGEGIATTINAMNEDIYKELGLKRINLYGVSDARRNEIGGYSGASHWAANGFNWQDTDDRQEFLNAIHEAVFKGDDTLFSSPQQRLILRELLQAAQDQTIDDPNALTAGDFAGWPGFTQWFKDLGVSLYYTREL